VLVQASAKTPRFPERGVFFEDTFLVYWNLRVIREGMATIKNTGARYEILVNGVVRSHRDSLPNICEQCRVTPWCRCEI
jgi:hypothetical protein